MSSIMRDLWPDDIKSEEVISPEEILKHQASRLEARTNGLLIGHVVRHAGEDRVVIGFEVEAPAPTPAFDSSKSSIGWSLNTRPQLSRRMRVCRTSSKSACISRPLSEVRYEI